MKISFRIMGILLALAFVVVGCSSDDPAAPTPNPNPGNPSGSLGLFASPDGSGSTITDTGGLVNVYVVHKAGTDGATACEFRVEAPAGWTRLAAVPQFGVSLGDVDQGIAIAYGQCVTDKVNVLTLTYQAPGGTTPGEMFRLQPPFAATGTPAIKVVDCNFQAHTDADIGEALVN